jgi:membrane protein YqaA with SNARE-associated domain
MTYHDFGRTSPKVFLYLGLKIVASRREHSFSGSYSSSAISQQSTMLATTTKKQEANNKLQHQYGYYQSLFGCSPEITAEIWYRVAPHGGETSLTKGAEPRHLLWALLFMKLYANDTALCAMVGGVDIKTFRFWTRYFIGKMSRTLFHLEVSYISEELSFVIIHALADHFVNNIFISDKLEEPFKKGQW